VREKTMFTPEAEGRASWSDAEDFERKQKALARLPKHQKIMEIQGQIWQLEKQIIDKKNQIKKIERKR
jgi:hypothetical protein